MRCSELPPPPRGRVGWPWTEDPPLPGACPVGRWPRISIVMPSYNRRTLLEESLRSVLLQGYPDLELLVIDGGSRRETIEILERYDPWITFWESEPDRGWGHAVNKGLARCTGDVVTFFASDDLYLPGAFGTVGARWHELDGHGAMVGGFFHVDRNSRLLEREYIPPRLPRPPAPIDLSLVAPQDWRLHQVGTFFLSHALDTVGRSVDEDLTYNADRELLYRVSRHYAIDLIPRPLAAFRIHRGSLTGAARHRSAAQLEYARMQLSFCLGDADDRRRQRIARHYFAKAQMSFAKYNGRRPASIFALFKALRYQPSRLWTRAYLKLWLALLGWQPTQRSEVGGR